MRFIFTAAYILLFAALQAPAVMASALQEEQAKADQYYQQGNFKKAHKAYLKLAKTGGHYSQDRVSHMYANGEGKSASLTNACPGIVLLSIEVESYMRIQNVLPKWQGESERCP